MLTYNVQFAQFDPEQVEERGSVTEREALQALSEFPFASELAKLKELTEGCSPTIRFMDSDDNSSLAIWIDESHKFTVEGRLQKRSFSLEHFTDSLDVLLQALTHFIHKDWQGLKETLGYEEPLISFNPKLAFFVFFELLIIGLSFATCNLRPAIARALIDDPNTFERFVGQFLLLNLIVALALFLPSRRKE